MKFPTSNLYPQDPDIGEAWKDCIEFITLDKTKWLDFIIQDGMFFKGSHLCIPINSMRENLIKEKHSGGLDGYFLRDKTIALVAKNYYWPIRCEEVCTQFQSISDDEKSEVEYRVVSAIICTREVMGGCQHGFYVWITKDTMRV